MPLGTAWRDIGYSQNPINARKGITTETSLNRTRCCFGIGQNPINARKGITTITEGVLFLGGGGGSESY